MEGINLGSKIRCCRNNHYSLLYNNQPKSDSSFYFTRLMEDLHSALWILSPHQSLGIPRVLSSAKGTCQSLSWVSCSHQFPVRCPLSGLAQFLQDCYLQLLLMVIAAYFLYLSSRFSISTRQLAFEISLSPQVASSTGGVISSLLTGYIVYNPFLY